MGFQVGDRAGCGAHGPACHLSRFLPRCPRLAASAVCDCTPARAAGQVCVGVASVRDPSLLGLATPWVSELAGDGHWCAMPQVGEPRWPKCEVLIRKTEGRRCRSPAAWGCLWPPRAPISACPSSAFQGSCSTVFPSPALPAPRPVRAPGIGCLPCCPLWASAVLNQGCWLCLALVSGLASAHLPDTCSHPPCLAGPAPCSQGLAWTLSQGTSLRKVPVGQWC